MLVSIPIGILIYVFNSAADVRSVAYVGEQVGIKASGGTASLRNAEDFINIGDARLGTSRIVSIIKNKISNN